ncbi:MAG: tetratricopeptide repeat protein, partial [Pseudomonadota bacterium]
EASALFDEALPVMRAELGEDNARLGAFFVQEAGMYARSGEHQRAVDRLDATLQIYAAALKPDHPEVGTALLGRGQARVALEQPDAAESDLLRAAEILESGLGAEHPYTIEAQAAVVSLYESQGESVKAQPWRDKLQALPPELQPDL